MERSKAIKKLLYIVLFHSYYQYFLIATILFILYFFIYQVQETDFFSFLPTFFSSWFLTTHIYLIIWFGWLIFPLVNILIIRFGDKSIKNFYERTYNKCFGKLNKSILYKFTFYESVGISFLIYLFVLSIYWNSQYLIYLLTPVVPLAFYYLSYPISFFFFFLLLPINVKIHNKVNPLPENHSLFQPIR